MTTIDALWEITGTSPRGNAATVRLRAGSYQGAIQRAWREHKIDPQSCRLLQDSAAPPATPADRAAAIVELPPARSFAVIRREARKRATAYPVTPGDKDWQAMRAWQYAMAMRGIETKFQPLRWKAAALARFDKAPDGSRRVRAVDVGDHDEDWREIPHWDFVASIVEVRRPSASSEAQGVFA